MANKVSSNNEIYLNGVYYPVTRPVQSVLASLYPAKVVIGDTSKDSQIRSSVVAWSDWRGGIGVERMEGAGETDRAWWSTCQLRHKNHLVLPGKDIVTTTPTHTRTGPTIGAIEELGGFVYAAWNGSTSQDAYIYKYSNATGTDDSWAKVAETDDQVTDVTNFTDRTGTTYLVFAHYDANGSGYTYTSDGSNWTTDSYDGAGEGAQYLTTWDERLWGINYAGQLWYTSVIAESGVNTDAKLPLPDGYVTKLFVARDASGEPIIYAATKKGLWAHDATNSRFVETQLGLPFHPHAGKGTLRWRDSVYVPSGLTLYKYVNGANQAVVTTTGPDRDDGLPTDNRGSILQLAATHNELIATVDATVAPLQTSGNSVPFQWTMRAVSGSHVIDSVSSYSSILGYNELGWETKWLAGTQGRGIDSITVNSAYDEYRIWWGFNGEVYYLNTSANIINPAHLSNYQYDISGVHQTPWFNAGQGEVDKVALKLKIDIRNAIADQSDSVAELSQDQTYKRTVKIEYATDYDDDNYSIFRDADGNDVSTEITTNGVTELIFRDGSFNPTGEKFQAIKFKITLFRTAGAGSDATSDEEYLRRYSPDVVSTTLEYRKKLDSKWGHQVNVDLSRPYKGNTPKQLRAHLKSAIENDTLVEFTFRDDDSANRNYFVDVVSATGLESTGYDERGASTISLMEP